MYSLYYNFSQYVPRNIKLNIVNISNINEKKLQRAIDEFQLELKWDDMWGIDDAKYRLDNGWYFNIIEIEDKIVGWVWFNSSKKELCNLYVHKKYRRIGIGMELIYSIMNLAFGKKIKEIYSKVDDWNSASYSSFIKCGWLVR